MIRDKDRSYYIGASDTVYVMRNWDTKTFEKWYMQKQGFSRQTFESEAMKAGTAFEHRILESLGIPGMEMDKQIISGRLRVNLDGNTISTIYEVKTYRDAKPFKVPKQYRDQVQVQMYASEIRKSQIVAYQLEEEDYQNYYRNIDPDRLTLHPIEYDPVFVEHYLSRYRFLSECLDDGRFPTEERYAKWKQKEN